MTEFTVAIVALEDDQRTVLRMLVEGTSIAAVSGTFDAMPAGVGDVVLRRIRDLKPSVVLIDIPANNPAPAMRAIELLHAETPGYAVFATGDMGQPQTIVAAMRAGAREYLDHDSTPTQMLEAFVRLSSSQKVRDRRARGDIFSVINAKGGCGGTTVAVNTALAIQAAHGGTALVDMAPLGHVALHLNAKPQFTIADALRNAQRLDASLLESYATRHATGLHVLAGARDLMEISAHSGELARFFDLIVSHYRYVVVDLSSRLDQDSRLMGELSQMILLVANTDVPSLWSASRVQQFLGARQDRVRLVLNRFHKISGCTDADFEAATNSRIMWRIPDHYAVVAASIDRGIPVAQQNHTEISRSFVGLAGALTQTPETGRTRWSLFRSAA